jgi:3-mercaptopyruvate sulfurtransferase SseA
MNEQIKKLAEQAWKEILDETSINGDVSTMFSSDEVVAFELKFAELIVRECLGISYKESHLPNAILFDERSDKFIKDIHNRIDRATKKHFGVEE